MGKPSWRIQIYRALNTIDHIGHSKFAAKQEQDWLPGQAVKGPYSFGYKNLVFDHAITLTNWLREEYPDVRLFSEVDREMVTEYLGEKAATCTPDTIRTMLATLKKLQEGLRAINWIHEEIVPQDWVIDGRNPSRGPYTPDEATAIKAWIGQHNAEYGQALDFIFSSGARIDETLHLRSDKVFIDEGRVELQGKGGRVRKIQVLHAETLKTLELSKRFVYLTEQPGRLWKDGLERRVRQACEVLDIHRRGVHGFRATAACEFVGIKGALGYTDMEARHELAMWLGHNPHRTEVTYAYVPRDKRVSV